MKRDAGRDLDTSSYVLQYEDVPKKGDDKPQGLAFYPGNHKTATQGRYHTALHETTHFKRIERAGKGGQSRGNVLPKDVRVQVNVHMEKETERGWITVTHLRSTLYDIFKT